MSTVSLSSLEAKLAELANQIAAFKRLSHTLHIPYARIELRQGERYAGLILNGQGKPSYHLVLLPGDAEDKTWEQAKEWAAEKGGELPTRADQSLLFANLKGEFQDAYYWSGQAQETDSSWAWCQGFNYGNQDYYRKNGELRARAVRRVLI